MEIKYRLYDLGAGKYLDSRLFAATSEGRVVQKQKIGFITGIKIEIFSGIKDMNGADIYEGDVIRFCDKWEWYRGQYGIKMMAASGKQLDSLKAQYEAEPYEERSVILPESYEWLLSGEIQDYWEVIGNSNFSVAAQTAKLVERGLL